MITHICTTIEGNNIRNHGAEVLAKELAENDTLIVLDLSMVSEPPNRCKHTPSSGREGHF